MCVRDYKIPETDIVIEKGTSVVVSTLGIQTDPEYFENPELYNPERFSPEKKKDFTDNCYMPFGSGPRSCLGKLNLNLQFYTVNTLVSNIQMFIYNEIWDRFIFTGIICSNNRKFL